jgi:NDP-sugar pyrophosphorylase family protein
MLPIVILAGGLATRLRPVTETLPKSLIPVNKEPFVLHQLDLLKNKGFTKIHFCLGYLGYMVEELVMNSSFVNSMNITFSYDGEVLLGTGGAIKKILENIASPFFITYGDSYLDINYNDVETFFNENKKDELTGLMTVFGNYGKWDTSNVIFENKTLLLYSKKKKNDRMLYIDYGVGILSKNDFDNYHEGAIFDLADVYEQLSIDQNLLGFEVRNRFYEVGSFTGINDISNYLKQNK